MRSTAAKYSASPSAKPTAPEASRNGQRSSAGQRSPSATAIAAKAASEITFFEQLTAVGVGATSGERAIRRWKSSEPSPQAQAAPSAAARAGVDELKRYSRPGRDRERINRAS